WPRRAATPAGSSEGSALVSDGIIADTAFMRALAQRCDEQAAAIRGLLSPAVLATGELGQAAPGWTFPGSLGAMTSRWETLNKLLHDEIDGIAANIRFAASEYELADRAFGAVLDRLLGS